MHQHPTSFILSGSHPFSIPSSIPSERDIVANFIFIFFSAGILLRHWYHHNRQQMSLFNFLPPSPLFSMSCSHLNWISFVAPSGFPFRNMPFLFFSKQTRRHKTNNKQSNITYHRMSHELSETECFVFAALLKKNILNVPSLFWPQQKVYVVYTSLEALLSNCGV